MTEEMAHSVSGMHGAEVKHAQRAKDLEIALREAAAIFKAELAVKGAELETLHSELGYGIDPSVRLSYMPGSVRTM
jgi:hypothetical protein